MDRKFWWAALVTTALAGCAEQTETTPDSNAAAPPAAAPAPAPAPGTEAPTAATSTPSAAADVTLTDEEVQFIKELPEDEQAIALAQKICPVGEEDGKPNHLGSMGKPVKVTYEGKTAFLCCAGCKADFEKDPKAALAKIGK